MVTENLLSTKTKLLKSEAAESESLEIQVKAFKGQEKGFESCKENDDEQL